jgi:ribose-phosphate pyrophosphokinase
LRIYTKSGDLAFNTFIFPDGQPHFKLETYGHEFSSVSIEAAIKSPTDLFTVLLANQVLREHGYSEVRLDIRYLMGARMDRAIDVLQPFTLELVSRLINSAGFTKIRILDVHSEVATRLIRNSVNVLPRAVVGRVFDTLSNPVIACPDKGAVDRVNALTPGDPKVYCQKERDPQTGKLNGFRVIDNFEIKPSRGGANVLIVDDICDGGGTFIGLAKELRRAGARSVFLYVTHGIFSKGLPLEGIDQIYTTNSYSECKDFIGRVPYLIDYVTWIPIFMKEMQ